MKATHRARPMRPLAKAKPRSDDERLRRLAPSIAALARRVWRETGGPMDVEDLNAAGWLAVAITMDAHDPSIAPFDKYARQRARWAMYDAVRVAMRRVAVQRGAPECAARGVQNGQRRVGHRDPADPVIRSQLQMDLPCGRIEPRGDVADLALAPDGDPEDATVSERRARRVRAAVARLPPRERAIVERHYFAGDRFNHIARDMSLSPYAVSRAHRRAIGRLERDLASELDAA